MTETTPTPTSSPLAGPEPWDLVAGAYRLEVAPIFETFAKEALRLAGVKQGMRVVDVACGPGTLSFLAAQAGATVDAIDFSPRMLAELHQRTSVSGFDRVSARVGDGMSLPYDDASFDAGFSMFGLMFFPDRARGFNELARVLKPNARAVVSSWTALDKIPLLGATFRTLNELLPPAGPPPKSFPLVERDECRTEMTAGGFTEVAVHELAATLEIPSMQAYIESIERSNAPIVLMRKKLGKDWDALRAKLLERLTAQFGAGPQSMSMPANVIVGARA